MRRGGREYICGFWAGSDPAPISAHTEDIVLQTHSTMNILRLRLHSVTINQFLKILHIIQFANGVFGILLSYEVLHRVGADRAVQALL